jgi:galactokinase
MIGAKAYGAKISGAGLGGSLIALVDNNEYGKTTLEAGLKEGAKQGWVSSIGPGARVENLEDRCIQGILRKHQI